MSVCLVTGSAGLIGSEACRWFAAKGMDVVGIDNNMRAVFFGSEASTLWNSDRLQQELGSAYTHYNIDIRDTDGLRKVFEKYGTQIKLIVHAAAQPSHDWAANSPQVDFSVNANGTLNLLECTRHICPDAVLIFTSTNKVYGDAPNDLPLVERETRWELDASHPWFSNGISEEMSIDQSKHSLFGASKVAADVLVQEYGHYFGMKTAIFRGGCLTGPMHSGTELHGFLAYLMKCAITGRRYTIYGYKGKQVRDNIHSRDLIACFDEVFHSPRIAEVYNIGGGRFSNCSMREAIILCEELVGKPMNVEYCDTNRIGDHIWYISDLSKFKMHYPNWKQEYDVPRILKEIHARQRDDFGVDGL